ncbi:FxsB family cyclophane-forming radical SAM/SPASM peptide maturase [Streptacidiphilus cavernicola]|uniref:FxsB family cyclophane-forming radical SAM/SPASM peptide maturase n=1 Tax=Streptacidiphilus cavernicola TaxID=3342716 RepID=A0ABV6VNZ6_9ACTN
MDSETAVFRQFVLKLHSRCDLACDHCYVYEHADTSWRGKPLKPTPATLRRTARRIAEHAFAHGLPEVRVVLHGGEPLLAGLGTIRLAAEALRSELGRRCALDLRIQTNGVGLDQDFLDLFEAHRISVGISLDGDRAANDLHRRYADGRSSHDRVLRGVALLRRPRYRHLYAGLLCTVDVRNDPLAVYAALRALEPPALDFLLPHATWEQPPLRPEGPGSTPYADWLGVIRDRWLAEGRPVPVRMFDSVLRTLDGRSSLTESLGLEPADLVVVETDGTLEQADSLKTAYDGAPATGLDVWTHSFDDAAAHPGLADRRRGAEGLSATCGACPVLRSCGGGLYAHRYRADTGFLNPSVYCDDLKEFIGRTAERRTAERRGTPDPHPAAPTDAQLDELAAGPGGAGVVLELADAERFVNGLLLDNLRRRAAGDPAVAAAWELVLRLGDEAPDAVEQVLGHPYLRPWAERALSGRRAEGTEQPADPAGLAEPAAAMALRAGAAVEVPVPVRDGLLRLPTLGVLRTGAVDRVLVDAAGRSVTTTGGERLRLDRDEPRWQPVRRAALPAAGGLAGWTLALEDADPERDCYRSEPSARLNADELACWERELIDAWRMVAVGLPEYAEGLREGLSALTPLVGLPGGRLHSASVRSAFGAVGIARPGTPELLAELLLHEFQHVKLGAVLDLADLFDRGHRGRFTVPWRSDPRPVEGALQGTYAHLALGDFWRARAEALAGPAAAAAARRGDRFLAWTAEVCTALLESGALSPSGVRFVSVMRATVAAKRS